MYWGAGIEFQMCFGFVLQDVEQKQAGNYFFLDE